MTRTEAAAEKALPMALRLIEFGGPKEPSCWFAAQFVVFMDHNADVAAGMVSEGHSPEHVADEMLVAFRVYLVKQIALRRAEARAA